MLSVKQVAEMFSVTKQTVFNWINTGYIKATMIGGQYRIEQSEIDRIKRGDS